MDLKTARQEAGLTQKELGEKAGITEVAVCLLENKKTVAQNETRRKLEKALGVRVNWLATHGLRTYRTGEMTSWELVEHNFRRALYGINSLQPDELAEFLELAEQYPKDFKKEIKATSR